MQFADLRLIEPILRAVRTAGYDQPTPIQRQAIPHVLAGRDVLGCAQTGTGKTAAFALPILQRLDAAPKSAGPRRIRTLVLCPTRELASQIHESFLAYGRHTRQRCAVIFGGVNQNPQVRAIRAGVDILVATPGRLRDLMGQGLISLNSVEILVLDEADRMLDMGFLPDLRKIIAAVPTARQTLLFSATMPDPIRKLTQDILKDPATVEVTPVSSAAPTVEHSVYHVEKPQKMALLTRLLAETPYSRALVFTRTKHGADRLVRHLAKAGVDAAALHGNKSQNARTRALADFRSARTPVLVATDIAARGLDVDDISHVYNFDLTADPETYVHRIGRTGRAGATGTAVSFCTADDRGSLADIERLIRAPIQRVGESAAPAAERQPAATRSHEPRATKSQATKPQATEPKAAKPRRNRRRRGSRNEHAPAARNEQQASPVHPANSVHPVEPQERRSMRAHRSLSRRGRAAQPVSARA
ncbi:MAG TPA: DEAD/DEAH box helicase [Phycisphaerae bacterium]|nr:DEAD/DEAH box helicase [Phycisphaerae bacterium]